MVQCKTIVPLKPCKNHQNKPFIKLALTEHFTEYNTVYNISEKTPVYTSPCSPAAILDTGVLEIYIINSAVDKEFIVKVLYYENWSPLSSIFSE